MIEAGIQAVVFDLDDTLYPEREYVTSGFRAVAEMVAPLFARDPEETAAEFEAIFESADRHRVFDRWLQAADATDAELLGEMIARYRTHPPDIRLFPEAEPLLLALREGGRRVAVLSDGRPDTQRLKLSALGLEPRLDDYVVTGDLGENAGKPSTAGYSLLLERLGVPPDAAVYVADNPRKDFLGARRLGMLTIQVRYPRGVYRMERPPTSEHAPHEVVDGLGTVLAVLRRLHPD